jgi:hypothetical protein
MSNLTLDTPRNLVLGLLTGIVFGFLLQRGAVSRYRTILGQLLLVDFTMLRVMLTAIVVGAVGVQAMRQAWDIPLHVKDAQLLANGVGGLVFGIGMALLGYCPGTAVAAAGEGSRHAAVGLVGMLVGAGAYAELYPWAKSYVLNVWNLGKVALPDAKLTGVSPWIFIASLAAATALLFILLRNKDRPTTT